MSHTKLGLKLFTEVWMLLTLAMNLISQKPIMLLHKRLRIGGKKSRYTDINCGYLLFFFILTGDDVLPVQAVQALCVFYSFLIAHEQFPGQTNQSTQPSGCQQFSEASPPWKCFKSQAEHKEE